MAEATTDLRKLVFAFGTKPAVSADGCYALLKKLGEGADSSSSEAIFHRVPFRVEAVSDGGMSHWIDSRVYGTYRGGTCFLFERAVLARNGIAGDVTQKQWKEIKARMDAIAPTIRFGDVR